ncbi:MAG: hypothetical protein ABI824_19870 [Acidobacteriota bacterium]
MTWEYCIEEGRHADFGKEWLNRQGQEGWELCAVVPEGATVRLVFKRPMPQKM